MAMLDDWLEYLTNPASFDKFHFEALMLELDTPRKLDMAFSSLPGGLGFVSRIETFRKRADFNGTYLLPPTPVKPADENVAQRYCDGLIDRLREIGEKVEADAINAAPIEVISKKQYDDLRKSGSILLLNAPMTIQEDFSIYLDKFPGWIDGFYEAIYAMSTFPEITRYLMAPVVNYPFNEDCYAELWLQGHTLDFCEDRTLLILGGAG